MIQKQDNISVTEFLAQVKGVLKQYPLFNNVAIVGEVSNFKAHGSGHFYFSLKDSKSRIACVMFRSDAQKILFKPKDGDKVVVHARLDVFEQSGMIQLYVSRMNLDGLGDLYIQYEKLKKHYEGLGYFKPEIKKPIPQYPNRIAVITGANSAAFHDIMRTLHERWPLAQVEVCHTLVQGPDAAIQISREINRLNLEKSAEVLIIARGGGSIEDLWAFNEALVVEGIVHSNIPVISGIGHESDTTLSDLVSDYRAATPTAAAVHATPSQIEIQQNLRTFKNTYYKSVVKKHRNSKHELSTLLYRSRLDNPIQYVELKQHQLNSVVTRILHQTRRFNAIRVQLANGDHYNQQLLNRRIENSAFQIKQQDLKNQAQVAFNIQKSHIRLQQQNRDFKKYSEESLRLLRYQKTQISNVENRVIRSWNQGIILKKRSLTDIMKLLSHYNPASLLLRIQEQGYAYIEHKNEHVTRLDDVKENDEISIRLKDGNLKAKIIGKEMKDDKTL